MPSELAQVRDLSSIALRHLSVFCVLRYCEDAPVNRHGANVVGTLPCVTTHVLTVACPPTAASATELSFGTAQRGAPDCARSRRRSPIVV